MYGNGALIGMGKIITRGRQAEIRKARARVTPTSCAAARLRRTTAASEAIDRAPSWLRHDLAIAMQGLDPDLQNEYGALIVDLEQSDEARVRAELIGQGGSAFLGSGYDAVVMSS